jgi:shikimate dehydrogenase
MTLRFGVLGHPVSHSLSPAIHRTFYARHAIDATYDHVDVPPEAFGDFLTELSRGGWQGLNVTFPYKWDVARHLTDLDPLASELEAVNTLVKRGGEVMPYRGHNTDGEGFCLFLERELAFDLSGRTVVMLGAGSSAKSVLASLAGRGPKRITVANRTSARLAEPFFEKLAARADVALETFAALDGRWDALFAEADLLVHATPFGLSGHAGEPLPAGLAHLTDRTLVVDLNYRKSEPTPFLRGLTRGVGGHDGRGMLLYQAAEAFRLWFGFLPDCSGMLSSLASGTGS